MKTVTPTRKVRSTPVPPASSRPVPDEEEIIQSLAGNSDRVSPQELDDWFGSDVPELRQLAQERNRSRKRSGRAPTVFLLHGIMGSELGFSRRIWDDVLWLGLFDVIFGNLRKLALGPKGDARVKALGFLPGVYLKMRLHLEREGFTVTQHFFDWRQNLQDLGAELKKRVEAQKTPVSIVAHSMGGLVSRAAFRQGMRNVSKFIMLAVPNHGSLAPVEALRGQYSLARTIAGADLKNDALGLAKDVFGTFPGLYQMILQRRLHPALDLLDPDQWPKSGPQPDARLLALPAEVENLLAVPTDTPDIPWFLIAGVDQPTKVAAQVDREEFVYTVSQDGDGTVPLESALLPDVKKTWFASAGHGFFANHEKVRLATIDILRSEDTQVLPASRPPLTRSLGRVRESELFAVAATRQRARQGERMTHRDRIRAVLGEPESFVPSITVGAADTSGGYLHRLEKVTVGRKKQRRLEIVFYNGSITDVNARAYVLGTFTGVTPSGASGALDEVMDGAIAELIGHNMFGSRTGEVFILPLARRELRAEVGVFVGMGQYNEFKALPAPPPGGRGTDAYLHRLHVPALEIASENCARMLARTNVDEFATVLLGGTIANDLAATGESMLRGFLRGLEQGDVGEGVRRLVICETDPERFRALRGHLVYLATTPLCEDIEFVLSEMEPPPEVRRLRSLGVSLGSRRTEPEPAYLLVTADSNGTPEGSERWTFALLGPSNRAAVREKTVFPHRDEIRKLLAPLDGDRTLNLTQVRELGKRIATELLPAEIRADLFEMNTLPLVILHNAEASRIPWETLEISGPGSRGVVVPAIEEGISRRFLASSQECTRWSTGAARSDCVRVLLISDPTEDLEGAAREADAIRKALGGNSRFQVDHTLRGPLATRDAIRQKLASGVFDIVHYSGHAYFDARKRDQCGLICAGEEVLTGKDIEGIAKLPFLVVLNACQSGRQRNRPARNAKKRLERSAPRSIAETLLCSGIANFVGTYWPVDDGGAAKFAETFYAALLGEKCLGEAMILARRAIRSEEGSPANEGDRANYILFGNRAARIRP